jgi:hypothetical protein
MVQFVEYVQMFIDQLSSCAVLLVPDRKEWLQTAAAEQRWRGLITRKKVRQKKRGAERRKKYKRVSPVMEKGRQQCEGTRVELGKADANATAKVRVTHDC